MAKRPRSIDLTRRERHLRWEERQRARGMVKVTAWVPRDQRRQLTELARRLREQHQS